MQHTVVISDAHLCEGVPGDDLWLRWRQRPYFPDAEFAELIDTLLARTTPGEDSIELVFNGDLFDFDAGRVIDGVARFEDLPRTEPVAMEQIDRILDDHDGYVRATARVLAAGHRVVFISGNHDPQLAFEGVRARIRHRLTAVSGDPSAAERVLFRAWFHHTPDRVHIEHGNQYDPYCSFRYAMIPHRAVEQSGEQEIQPTVGSLAFRHLSSRMGYFNPHVDASFMLSITEYLTHWAKHYLFTEHHLATPYVKGTVELFTQLIEKRDPGSPDRALRNLQAAAAETGASLDAVARHAALQATPAEDALHRVVREFWVDRFALGALSLAAVATPLLSRNKLTIALALTLPAAFAAYELALPKPTLDDNWNVVSAMSPRIAEIYGSRAVVFGHTHIPYGRWEDGIFHGNSGTWTAAYRDMECSIPVDSRGKPVIWIRSEGARTEGGLYRWNEGQLVPDTEHGSRAPGAITDEEAWELVPEGMV